MTCLLADPHSPHLQTLRKMFHLNKMDKRLSCGGARPPPPGLGGFLGVPGCSQHTPDMMKPKQDIEKTAPPTFLRKQYFLVVCTYVNEDINHTVLERSRQSWLGWKMHYVVKVKIRRRTQLHSCRSGGLYARSPHPSPPYTGKH